MKRYLLLLLAIAMKMASMAQDTTLLTVVEGRVWNIVSIIPSEPPESDTIPGYYKDIKGRWGVGWPHTIVLKGDTIMNGVSYKKLFNNGRFVCGLREEDGCIYECHWDGVPEQTAFNFNLRPGDIFKGEINDTDQLEIKQVRTFDFNGTSRRCMDIWAYQEEMEYMDALVDYWIEGIGCMAGPYLPFWWNVIGPQALLLSCYDGDECIFTIEDLKRFTNPSSCPDDNHPHAIDLGLPSGTKWACCNVGASIPEGYGGYYAWGETEGKHIYDWYTYIHCDGSMETCHDIGSDISGTEYDVAHVKWGDIWVMPSLDQLCELLNNCSYISTSVNGISGGNYTGPNGGTIFLPLAGYRKDDAHYSGDHCQYWSSTLCPYGSRYAHVLSTYVKSNHISQDDRCIGHTVRPVISGTTDINLLESPSDTSSQAIYNLYGIKVADNAADMNTLPPGIYIINGKKIVIK